jgi:hypothetical protein
VRVGVEENLSVGNGWRRVARLGQVIHGEKFGLVAEFGESGTGFAGGRSNDWSDGWFCNPVRVGFVFCMVTQGSSCVATLG